MDLIHGRTLILSCEQSHKTLQVNILNGNTVNDEKVAEAKVISLLDSLGLEVVAEPEMANAA